MGCVLEDLVGVGVDAGGGVVEAAHCGRCGWAVMV